MNANQEAFPQAGGGLPALYMGPDEGEFDEEISELRKREHTIIY